MALFFQRLKLALMVNQDFYEEVINDPKTQGHSLWVVALFAMTASFGIFSRVSGTAVNINLMVTLITWYIWAFTTYYIGTHFFSEKDTPRDRKAVMRIIGFASAPGILRLFSFIPYLSGLILLLSSVWMIYAASLALKRALNYTSMARAVGVTVLSFALSTFVQFILLVMLFQLFAVKAAQ